MSEVSNKVRHSNVQHVIKMHENAIIAMTVLYTKEMNNGELYVHLLNAIIVNKNVSVTQITL